MFRIPNDSGHRRHDWADGRAIASLAATPRGSVVRSYDVVELDNGLIRVGVAPELGMRILYAQDLRGQTPVDLFARYDDPANPVPFAGNIGGVKPSFPFFENGTGLIDPRGELAYAAGHTVQLDSDGSAAVVMHLPFSHHQTPCDSGFLGRYGDKVLGAVVSVEPGRADFALRLIAENPNPLRRGDRIWTAATLPRVLGRDDDAPPRQGGGAWLLPARWATTHNATELIDLGSRGGVDDPRQLPATGSMFALAANAGFAGGWYPAECGGLNRLALFDPTAEPGIKIYDKGDDNGPFELWIGNTEIFEAPRGFLEGFASSEANIRYAVARGVGRVFYANRHVAFGRDPGNGVVRLSGFGQRRVDVIAADGRMLATRVEIGPAVAPNEVAATIGARLLDSDTGEPLGEIPAVADRIAAERCFVTLRAATRRSVFDPRTGPVLPLGIERAPHYELEDTPSKWNTLSSLAALRAAGEASYGDDPDALASIANAVYRHGDFVAAERLLAMARRGRRAATRSVLRLLRALIDYEQGLAADFTECGPRGGYFRAMQAIAAGNPDCATVELEGVVATLPDCVRPRLVLAYISRDPAWAAPLREQLPSSPELWWTLAELGNDDAAKRCRALACGGETQRRLEAFADECRLGHWRHERRYEYDAAQFAGIALPPFPPHLRLDGGALRPPRIRLTSPTQGSAGDTTLTADVTSSTALDRVVYFVDGRRLGESDRPPYSVAWRAASGEHDVLPVAIDALGNRGVPHTTRVRVA